MVPEEQRLDRETMSRLYQQHASDLLALARTLTLDVAEAEDLVHDSFVRLARRWPQLASDASLGGYLRTTLVNLARDRYRRTGVRSRRIAALVERTAVELSIPSEHAEVVVALRRLSERQRTCLALRFYEQLNDAEIATELGLSVGAVSSHIHRGLAKLRKLVPEDA